MVPLLLICQSLMIWWFTANAFDLIALCPRDDSDNICPIVASRLFLCALWEGRFITSYKGNTLGTVERLFSQIMSIVFYRSSPSLGTLSQPRQDWLECEIERIKWKSDGAGLLTTCEINSTLSVGVVWASVVLLQEYTLSVDQSMISKSKSCPFRLSGVRRR